MRTVGINRGKYSSRFNAEPVSTALSNVYKNSEFGISFNIPKNFTLQELRSDTFTISLTDEPGRDDLGNSTLKEGKTQIDIIVGGDLIKRNITIGVVTKCQKK